MKFKKGDKVRILDGSKIDTYTGFFVLAMKGYVGKEATIEDGHKYPDGRIGYRLNEFGYIWDERGLEFVKPETIVIYRKGREVIALDKTSGKKGIAKLHPDDTFDFMVGAKLAFDRLLDIDKKEEPEQPKDEFLREFKEGRTYVFRKHLLDASGSGFNGNWEKTCDGKIVDVTSRKFGDIDGYSMCPQWCEELPIAVGDRVEVVSYGSLYRSYDTWEGLKGFESNWVEEASLPTDGEYKVVAIKEHGRAEGILYLIQNRKTTQVFIMGMRGLKKIESEDEA